MGNGEREFFFLSLQDPIIRPDLWYLILNKTQLPQKQPSQPCCFTFCIEKSMGTPAQSQVHSFINCYLQIHKEKKSVSSCCATCREKGGEGEEGVRDKDREGEKGRERKRNLYLDFSVSSVKQ